jgi:hypothetical protein
MRHGLRHLLQRETWQPGSKRQTSRKHEIPVLHLDVRVGTGLVGEKRLAALEAECARLVALAAVRVRLLPADGDDESCLVMQDIEGNEFCLD